jgi:hypothetical protein
MNMKIKCVAQYLRSGGGGSGGRGLGTCLLGRSLGGGGTVLGGLRVEILMDSGWIQEVRACGYKIRVRKWQG